MGRHGSFQLHYPWVKLPPVPQVSEPEVTVPTEKNKIAGIERQAGDKVYRQNVV